MESTKTQSEAQSHRKKLKNIAKHIRIAHATKGHEREVHITRAEKLAERYGFSE